MDKQRIIPHSDKCKAGKWVKDGDAPFKWNVTGDSQDVYSVTFNLLTVDATLQILKPSQSGKMAIMLRCADINCPGRKIIPLEVLGFDFC